MSDDALKTFDNLTSISNQDIDDDLDIVPITHGIGTVSQGDKKVKIGQFQQMTVLRCRTAGNVVNKQAEYVGGLPLNGNGQSCVGRTVLVIFENKNTADSPTFSYNNLTGPIKLLNQSSNVTLGTGCINANSRNIMTWDGESWCLHSNIAKVTSGYTEYADGTIVYKSSLTPIVAKRVSVDGEYNVEYTIDITDLEINATYLINSASAYAQQGSICGILHRGNGTVQFDLISQSYIDLSATRDDITVKSTYPYSSSVGFHLNFVKIS